LIRLFFDMYKLNPTKFISTSKNKIFPYFCYMLRKVIPAFFLLVFFTQVLGFTVYFNHEKNKIRKELKTIIKEGVPENQLIKFKFTPKQFSKLNFIKKKEFKIGENYYDIVFKSLDKKGNILLKCVNDKQETILFKNLTQNVNFNLGNEPNKSPLKIVFSIVEKPFLGNTLIPKINLKPNYFLENKSFFSYSFFAKNRAIHVDIPPPKHSLFETLS
jgi:hypothetical protein